MKCLISLTGSNCYLMDCDHRQRATLANRTIRLQQHQGQDQHTTGSEYWYGLQLHNFSDCASCADACFIIHVQQIQLCLLVSAKVAQHVLSFAVMVSHACLRVNLLVFFGTVGGRMAGT